MTISDFPVLISTHEVFHLIFSSCLVEEEEWERGWVGILQPAKVNPRHLFSFYPGREELRCWAPCSEWQSLSGTAVKWCLPSQLLGACVDQPPWLASDLIFGVVSHLVLFHSNINNFCWVVNVFNPVLLFFHCSRYATAAQPVYQATSLPYFHPSEWPLLPPGLQNHKRRLPVFT